MSLIFAWTTWAAITYQWYDVSNPAASFTVGVNSATLIIPLTRKGGLLLRLTIFCYICGKYYMRINNQGMMEFVATYNLTGILLGLCTFLIIGAFHPLVIKSEYYFGTRCWWLFLLLGMAGTVAALAVREMFWSSLLGVFAFSSFWGIFELFQQRERVRKGWFPKRCG
jgi:hypothetical protein